jgi:hypothetical protein
MLDGLAVATHGGLPMEVPDGGLPAAMLWRSASGNGSRVASLCSAAVHDGNRMKAEE